MNIRKEIFLVAALVFATPMCAQTANTGNTSNTPAQQPPQTQGVHTAKQRDGSKVFAANCSRCHYAPESFSPRVSGTIVRHMRVRAGLSKEDEQAILHFLNP
jgi:cytochrome c5